MRNTDITYNPEYNGFPIMTDRSKCLGCYTGFLDKIKERLQYALSRHSQVLVIRFDVRYPAPIELIAIDDNSTFQGFLENYQRYLVRQGFDPIYLWCTERGYVNNKLHHHVAFLLDANKIRRMPTMSKANELWCRALNISYDPEFNLVRRTFPHSDTILHKSRSIIHRGDHEALNNAHYWLSYLAKVKTKNLPSGFRAFSCSMIPSSWNSHPSREH